MDIHWNTYNLNGRTVSMTFSFFILEDCIALDVHSEKLVGFWKCRLWIKYRGEV